MVFTAMQKAFMLEAYFRSGQNVDGVWRYSIPVCIAAFAEEYPQVPINYKHFYDALMDSVNIFRETGSVTRREGSGRPPLRTPENIENVRQIVTNAPTTSLRTLSQQAELSYGTCQRILKKDLHLHPYRLTAVHQLLPPDYARRVQFCRWFLANMDNNMLDLSFFSDEAWCHVSGYINSQNMRMWAADNPHFYRETPLHPLKIGVWIGLSRRRLIGPIFFNGTLTARRYREEILQLFVNELHDDELQQGFFQQDGASAHSARETIEDLQQYYADRLISRNTPIEWPPRSCDLTPLDFFVWPYLKNSIFKTPINNLEELTRRITAKCEDLNNSPHILQNVFDGVRRRAQICIQEGGEHFQHLL